MFSTIRQATIDAKLSPLVSRIAVIVTDIAGEERGLRFIDSCRIDSCRLEDEAHGLALLDEDVVLN